MKYGCLLLIGLFHAACAAQYPVRLGDSTVIIVQEKHGAGKTFIHVHQNETTALKAARAVVKEHGGSVITLVHSGGRNIVFHLKNRRYEFDPNRIFTRRGIKKTLAEFSQATPEACVLVDKLASNIKHLMPAGKVIAVHNNESYSLHDYLPGHSLEADAKSLYVNQQHYYRNFYLVTKQADYKRLKTLNFNSVWQGIGATDDGSLSVFLAKSDYINVEAGYDQLAAQISMLMHA